MISPNGLISVNKSLKLITAKNNDKINVICDGKGPAIKVENLKSWYNKSDYSEAFKIKLNCKDEGAGVKNTILQSDYYGDYSWKKLDSKETKREDDCLDYFTYSKEGQFMYRILAYDNVGNITSIRSSFAVDLNAPVINDLQSEYGWSNSDISVNVKAVDNLSGVSNIRIYNNNDELINQIYSDTAEILFTEEQKELYYMVAEDKAGNVSDKYYFVVKIDKTAPQINIDDLESEAHISEENKSYYCLSGNAINITAKDEDENQIYSGIKRLVLKSQDNKSINSVENYDNNIVINNILNLKYDVTTSAERDYYIAVAIDGAGNISKKYIIPQICMSNRIRRYILHDNYEEQYGYYRIYE